MATMTDVCERCEEPVRGKRRDSPWRWAGAALLLVGLVVLWPLAVVGLLMAIFGGAKRVCPRCGRDDLLPLDSLRARRIIEGRGDRRDL